MSLTIDIDGEMAAELNQFRPKLEATLILHVGLGKDHFVPVSATYGMLLHTHTSLAPLQFFLGAFGCVPDVEGFTRASIA
jgi:hypothetical protein